MQPLTVQCIKMNCSQPIPDQPKTYAYCSDTLYNEKYFEQISNSTLLYHEATFLHDMLDRAGETHHTTALQAGQTSIKNKRSKNCLSASFQHVIKNWMSYWKKHKVYSQIQNWLLKGRHLLLVEVFRFDNFLKVVKSFQSPIGISLKASIRI